MRALRVILIAASIATMAAPAMADHTGGPGTSDFGRSSTNDRRGFNDRGDSNRGWFTPRHGYTVRPHPGTGKRPKDPAQQRWEDLQQRERQLRGQDEGSGVGGGRGYGGQRGMTGKNAAGDS